MSFAVVSKGVVIVKLNVVPLKGINDDELIDIARLSFTHPFHIRFIEYMPIGNNQMFSDRQLLAPEIKKRISSLGKLIAVGKDNNDGPANSGHVSYRIIRKI